VADDSLVGLEVDIRQMVDGLIQGWIMHDKPQIPSVGGHGIVDEIEALLIGRELFVRYVIDSSAFGVFSLEKEL
jgi:hypothetical protein